MRFASNIVGSNAHAHITSLCIFCMNYWVHFYVQIFMYRFLCTDFYVQDVRKSGKAMGTQTFFKAGWLLDKTGTAQSSAPDDTGRLE
jgi:hypothetical protein